MAGSERSSSAISASRQYAPYVEADWGFKNTWYPALFSHELDENRVKGVTMAGHDIVLRRSRGKVYALRDRCAHRGVKMSLRPICLTAGGTADLRRAPQPVGTLKFCICDARLSRRTFRPSLLPLV